MSAFMKRLEALESIRSREAPDDRVQVICIRGMTGADELDEGDGPRAALVTGTPTTPGASLSRHEGEPLADFLARVEVERMRVRGPHKGKPRARRRRPPGDGFGPAEGACNALTGQLSVQLCEA